MKKIIFHKAILVWAISILAVSCDYLPLQKREIYNGKPLDPYKDISVMEFIDSRPDLFSNLRSLIDICGIQDYYSQTEKKYTYLLLNNKAISNADLEAAATNEQEKERLRNVLLFHIVRGMYHSYGTLNYEPTYVVTLWEDPMAIMSLSLFKDPQGDRVSTGRVRAMEQCGTSTAMFCSASDHFFKNGVVHIFQSKLVYKK